MLYTIPSSYSPHIKVQFVPFFVFLSFRSGVDYHWYRLDDDGKWSHKPGQTRVLQYDNAGRYITDPRRANMGNYRFVGFMSTDSHGNVVNIR